MKNIFILIAICLLPFGALAQDEDFELPFDDEPLKKESLKYFVLAGGMTFDWLLIDESNLNSFGGNLPEDLKLSGPIHLFGGQGVTGIPWVKNLRIGFMGSGGSTIAEYKSETGTEQTNLDVSMFGFTVHYGYVPFEHFAILLGVNSGWGDMTYEYATGIDNGNEGLDAAGGSIQRFEKSYFFATPNLQFEYALANFIILRADASYNLSFAQDDNWTMNTTGTSVVNPDLNVSGLKIGFGIMVGLVNF